MPRSLPGRGSRGVEFNPMQKEHGDQFAPEVKNTIKLTLAFAKAVGQHQDDKGDNLVVSPYNAMAALGMAASGADGKTRDELAKALFGTDGKGLDQAVNDYAALNDKMLKANAGQVELTTANGIWTNKDFMKLRPEFVEGAKETFNAEMSSEKFGPATVDKINGWASKNTKGLIPKVLEELDSSDAAILASALYFKGQWTNKFDKTLTESKPFTQDDTLVSETPTMSQYFSGAKKVSHLQGEDFEAVALTYGEKDAKADKSPTMRIVLVRPSDETVSARDWLASQDKGAVPAWLDPAAFENGVTGLVELPRLDIKQTFDLIPALQDMGIKTAFSPKADFSRMVEEGGKSLSISKVSHDTVFKTDEEGSEAAAVTVVGMKRSMAMPMRQPIDFKLDRSFAFALQDVETGAVIFVGAVNKPNDDMKPSKAAKKEVPADVPPHRRNCWKRH